MEKKVFKTNIHSTNVAFVIGDVQCSIFTNMGRKKVYDCMGKVLYTSLQIDTKTYWELLEVLPENNEKMYTFITML